MAPKGMKRPAAAAAASKGKRGKPATFESKTKEKAKEVGEAIATYDGLEDSTKKMLCSVVDLSLTTLKADRHEYQTRMVSMVDETIDAMKQQLQAKLEAASAKVENAESQKAKNEETEKEAAAEVEKLKGLLDAAKEPMDVDAKTKKDAGEALSTAKKDQATGDADFEKMLEKKAALESAFKDIFTPLQSTKSKGVEGNKNLKKLEKVCTENKFDPALITSMPETLKKEPADRGTYDSMVVKQMEDTFGTRIASMTAELETLTPAKTERAAAVEAKEAELTAATEKASASKEAFEKAYAALQEGNKAQAAAKDAVVNFEKNAKRDVKELEGVKAELDKFTSGPLQAFLDLKDLEPPPPEPEPVAEPEAPQEPVAVPEEPAAPVAPAAPEQPTAPAEPAPVTMEE